MVWLPFVTLCGLFAFWFDLFTCVWVVFVVVMLAGFCYLLLVAVVPFVCWILVFDF